MRIFSLKVRESCCGPWSFSSQEEFLKVWSSLGHSRTKGNDHDQDSPFAHWSQPVEQSLLSRSESRREDAHLASPVMFLIGGLILSVWLGQPVGGPGRRSVANNTYFVKSPVLYICSAGAFTWTKATIGTASCLGWVLFIQSEATIYVIQKPSQKAWHKEDTRATYPGKTFKPWKTGWYFPLYSPGRLAVRFDLWFKFFMWVLSRIIGHVLCG